MTVIELPDEQAEALKVRAAAQGLTLEGWLEKLAAEGALPADPAEQRPLQTAADIILDRMRNLPPDIMASMPKDGASQHDHYIYGWPKQEE
jgi:plasmid stability protein